MPRCWSNRSRGAERDGTIYSIGRRVPALIFEHLERSFWFALHVSSVCNGRQQRLHSSSSGSVFQFRLARFSKRGFSGLGEGGWFIVDNVATCVVNWATWSARVAVLAALRSVSSAKRRSLATRTKSSYLMRFCRRCSRVPGFGSALMNFSRIAFWSASERLAGLVLSGRPRLSLYSRWIRFKRSSSHSPFRILAC